MHLPSLLYRVYERRLQCEIEGSLLPQHVAVIVDGNRRWARSFGASTEEGHRQGAAKISEFLTWCEGLGIPVVTVWLLSTDNLSRSPKELDALFQIILGVVERVHAAGYTVKLAGATDTLPCDVVTRLRELEESSAQGAALTVNVAIGYGGRQEITDAVRSLLKAAQAEGKDIAQVANELTPDAIGQHLYTRGQPDPDLIIRTSGEQRLSGFMMWQSVHSEFYFAETFWPEFRRVDFLRALRDYTRRERRFGA
ncbi:isoprenyl transferase [Dermabacteraceae bacterium P13115]|nr:isoprenyl transferase [Dermabacteraceae bacterium TAE3-ERU5]